MSAEESVDLGEIVAAGDGGEGVIWTLEESDDLNANLVSFGDGRGVGEHVNDEVDVVLVGVVGSGIATVDGREQELWAGTLAFVPKGARRSTRSNSDDFKYLSVHRRRGPIQLGDREQEGEA